MNESQREQSDGRVGFKLDPVHADGCWAAATPDAFVVFDGFEFRAKNGRRGGTWGWARFRCQDPACSGVKLVRWDVLSRWLTGADRGT